MLLRIGEDAPASSPLAKALQGWAKQHAPWLIGRSAAKLNWAALLAGLADAWAPSERRPQALELSRALGALLALDPFDAALLEVVVAVDRLPRPAAIARIATQHGHDLPALIGHLVGAAPTEAESRVRRSPVLRLGLARFVTSRQGHVELDLDWMLTRLLDRAPTEAADIVDALAGPRQAPVLDLQDFGHVADADLLVRLLRGAASERAAGINILIHGPPGTGKTELARTLADSAGLALHAVGEADADGDEPERWERVNALRLAQRLLAGRGHAALLFDEMEDLIGDAKPSSGDWFDRRMGSKVFVNRQLETNPVPVIWTTNAIGNIDTAILRRMSFVLRLDLPSRRTAERMLGRVAADEQIVPGGRFGTLLDAAPETATILRVAARAGRLAGEADGGARPAEALVRALRGTELPPGRGDDIGFELFETDRPLGPLFDRLVREGASNVSMLLTGPPGTGKTALAHHFARALDRPLLVKRASDLLSKWVGETEAQIASAFAEARQRGGILLFDEADSLLFDRTTARTSWEVSQVNELLTWLDHHPLPVIAATNHPGKLDPATLRRFVFKVHLAPLGRARSAEAFMRFFEVAAPASLSEITNLTPGDFAVVKRQLRWTGAATPEDLVERLRVEAACKPDGGGRIGF
jgi:SpoVK/Ycf46/Vps4 family AAA+-type ATPase